MHGPQNLSSFEIKRSPGSIPDRWINCPKHSSVISDLFVASKTFLNEAYEKLIPAGNTFSPIEIKVIESNLNIKIGAVIDLSNSKRYYQPSDFTTLGIQHLKIACAGHKQVPTRNSVQEFIQFCDDFNHSQKDKKILVHCTHGFNRTGFMITSYLVEKLDFDIRSALKIFAKYRPDGIYKKDYLEAIIQIYKYPGEDITIDPVMKPAWGRAITTNSSTIEGTAASSNSGTETSNQIKRIPIFPVANELISVVSVDIANKIKEKLDVFFNIKNEFPGAQPVSMSLLNLNLVGHKQYMVSWKADGTRFLMYIDADGKTYFIDRRYDIFIAPQFMFPSRADIHQHLSDCLFDGELVFEKSKETLLPRFLIFDAIFFDNMMLDCCFSKRLDLIARFVIEPRERAKQKGILKREKEPFSILNKKFYNKIKTDWLVEQMMPNLTHETDGLLFQPEDDNYHSGVCSNILKWKPSHLNSVDFYLVIKTETKFGCPKEMVGYLYVLGSETHFGTIKVDATIRKYDKKIIECAFDLVQRTWKFLRHREDKDSPNAYSTAISVLETIENPVHIDDIYKCLYANSKAMARKLPSSSNIK